MNVYEMIAIINATLSDEDTEAAIQQIKDLIVARGGELLKVDPWGRRRLSYEINKQTRGYYVLFLFRGPSDLVKKLEDYCKVTDSVFKYMVVKLEKKQKDAALRSLVEAPVEEPEKAESPEAAEATAAGPESEDVQ